MRSPEEAREEERLVLRASVKRLADEAHDLAVAIKAVRDLPRYGMAEADIHDDFRDEPRKGEWLRAADVYKALGIEP